MNRERPYQVFAGVAILTVVVLAAIAGALLISWVSNRQATRRYVADAEAKEESRMIHQPRCPHCKRCPFPNGVCEEKVSRGRRFFLMGALALPVAAQIEKVAAIVAPPPRITVGQPMIRIGDGPPEPMTIASMKEFERRLCVLVTTVEWPDGGWMAVAT